MEDNLQQESAHPLEMLFPDRHAQAFLTFLLGQEETKAACMLLEGFDINSRSETGWSLLEFSMACDEFELISLLLKLGASVDRSPDGMDGMTPLMLATGRQRPDWVRRCLEAGAGVDQVSRDGDTALIFASSIGNRDAVALLLNAGASINHQGYHMTTALHEAVKAGDATLTAMLLARGAAPELADAFGETAESLMDDGLGRSLASFRK